MIVLDFEKPIYKMQEKIEELKKLSNRASLPDFA